MRIRIEFLDVIQHFGAEVLTAVALITSMFWDATSCTTVKVSICFG
jgi:hypothetical protein